MFRSNETICVSPNKYGWHSIPLKNVTKQTITLVPPNSNKAIQYCNSDELILVALNPIKGFRQDQNCTAFRNFLIELDVSNKEQQIEYIKKMQLPYSAMVWSGSKSTHTLISLSEDLPNEKIYRLFAEWILNIISLADSNTKNPSRSIRIPGAIRPETKKEQELIEFHGPVSLQTLIDWLRRHPDEKPKEKQERRVAEKADFSRVRDWVCKMLVDGITTNRNKNWFMVGVEFAQAGYSEDDTILLLERYFEEEKDFRRREWLTALRSGMKYAYSKSQR